MSKSADRTALVIGHKMGGMITTDLILVWEADPIRGRLISIENVEAIMAILARSFNVVKVTTDGWEPTAPERLAKYGVECIRKSVKRDDFVNVRTLINSNSVRWYPVVFDSYNGEHYPDLMGWELGRLVDKGGKVEKGMNSTDDLADGLAGMIAPLVDLQELRDMAAQSAQMGVINRGKKGGSRNKQIISAPRTEQITVRKEQPRGRVIGRRR